MIERCGVTPACRKWSIDRANSRGELFSIPTALGIKHFGRGHGWWIEGSYCRARA
jgi:hypothetical protein